MIKVSVLYPDGPGIEFNMAYYLERHIPLVQKLLAGTLRKGAVDRGLNAGQPGTRPPYVAIGHLWFDSEDAFQASMAKHGQEMLGDIPNYTNSQPQIQVSEVKL